MNDARVEALRNAVRKSVARLTMTMATPRPERIKRMASFVATTRGPKLNGDAFNGRSAHAREYVLAASVAPVKPTRAKGQATVASYRR